MSVNQALRNILDIEEKRKENVVDKNDLVIGVCRIGQEDQLIKAGLIKDLIDFDFGPPLHSLIIPGKLQIVEEEMLELWK